jgi:hypothetical protein
MYSTGGQKDIKGVSDIAMVTRGCIYCRAEAT